MDIGDLRGKNIHIFTIATSESKSMLTINQLYSYRLLAIYSIFHHTAAVGFDV